MVAMIASKEVRVYIERDGDATVPELFLDVFWIRSVLYEQGRIRVPQIVKAHAAKASFTQTRLKSFSKEVIVHPLPSETEEDRLGYRMPFHGCL